jgi:hypothetical protein
MLLNKTQKAVAAKRLEETVKRLGVMRAEALRCFCERAESAEIVSLADKRQQHGRKNA